MRFTLHIDHVELVRALHYDPNTGIFRWRVDRNAGRLKAGTIAGALVKSNGYLRVNLNGQRIYLHRAAWVYCYGYIPFGLEIDHASADRTNNRISNLRLCVDMNANNQNIRSARSNNKSGLLGAYASTARPGKFRSSITTNGEQTYIGFFDSANDAHEAYLKEKRRQHAFCTV